MSRAQTRPAARAGTGQVLTGALASEWTKLWSVRSTYGTLLLGAALVAALGAVLGASASASAANGHDVTQPAPHLAAACLQLGQVAVVLLAADVITAEYATGTMATTVLAVPRRGVVLLAKALLASVTSAVLGVVLVLVGTGVVAPLMGDVGDFTGEQLAATAAGGGAYCALLAATTVGVGAATRSTAATLTGVVIALLLALQMLPGLSLQWLVDTSTYLPGAAALPLMTGVGTPYGPGTALVVLVVWVLAGLATGWVRLRCRDA